MIEKKCLHHFIFMHSHNIKCLKYYSEEDKPNPININSVSEYASEYVTKIICKEHYLVSFLALYGSRKNKYLGFTDKVLAWIKKSRELRRTFTPWQEALHAYLTNEVNV